MNENNVRAVALALYLRPRANLQEIAETAGMSKATLYRLAPSRDKLVELISTKGEQLLHDSILHARLGEPPHVEALSRLLSSLLKEREIYLCWGTNLWMHMLEGKASQPRITTWETYMKKLEVYFLEAQRAGTYRIDLSARWLAKAFDMLVCAAMDAAHRGEIPSADIGNMILTQFLQGAVERR